MPHRTLYCKDGVILFATARNLGAEKLQDIKTRATTAANRYFDSPKAYMPEDKLVYVFDSPELAQEFRKAVENDRDRYS